MTGYEDKSEGQRSADHSARQVVPPPRVEPVPLDGIQTAGSAGRGTAFWLTALTFIALGAIAVAVFVLLPRWVEIAPQQETGPVAGPTEPAPTVVPEALPSATESSPPEENGYQAPVLADSPPAPPAPNRSQEAAQPAPPARDPDEEAFARAMANGLAGLDRGELEQARAAFESALALSPADPGALEGLARVETAEQLATIAAHRERATGLESEERWAEAAAEYSAALALDPTLRFARDGLAQAGARSELDKQLGAHIGRPDRLSENAVLEQARRILAQAETTDPSGPVLERQIETLGNLIVEASTPIVVLLESDGETEVQIYRVGPLGSFERKQLELRPGTYTVVGSRKGFRDVRQKLEVKAGTRPTLTVRCEEKI